jgi:hypothetical protein
MSPDTDRHQTKAVHLLATSAILHVSAHCLGRHYLLFVVRLVVRSPHLTRSRDRCDAIPVPVPSWEFIVDIFIGIGQKFFYRCFIIVYAMHCNINRRKVLFHAETRLQTIHTSHHTTHTSLVYDRTGNTGSRATC